MWNSWYATAIHKQLGKTATEWKKNITCKLGILEQEHCNESPIQCNIPIVATSYETSTILM